MKKVKWGILSTAKIGIEKVIPAMQRSQHCEIVAISSRDEAKAQAAAKQLGIPKAYGSYDALLADPEIEAVYNPLPNHLHVPWSIKALEAGKHVLCEKPIGLNTAEARQLIDAAGQHPNLKVMEAFMYRHHPQWHKTRELVASGAIGQLRTIQAFFTYDNRDPNNIRNQPDIGGGGLMDIGCYCISQARFLFGTEPTRAFGQMEVDPQFQTDRLTSGILDFAAGTATFTCATQLPPYQSVTILGTSGRIEMEIPFTPTPDRAAVLRHTTETGTEEIRFAPADHYTLQGDLFAQSIRNDTAVPTPLEDALANMQVIEAVLASATTGVWQPL